MWELCIRSVRHDRARARSRSGYHVADNRDEAGGDMLEHPGRTFQDKTSYHRDSMEEHELDWRSKPPTYKFYSYAPVISLPEPRPGARRRPGTRSVDLRRPPPQRALLRRHSPCPSSSSPASCGRPRASPPRTSPRTGRTSTAPPPPPAPSTPSRPTWWSTRWRGSSPGSTTTESPESTSWSAPSSRAATRWSN